MAKGNGQKTANGSALDFEAQLWAAADKMRGHMDAYGQEIPVSQLRVPRAWTWCGEQKGLNYENKNEESDSGTAAPDGHL